MKIFLSLYPAGNASVSNSKTWLHNLYEPLLDLGHEVYLLRIDEAEKHLNTKRGTKVFKERFSEYLLKAFKEEHKKRRFDFFLSYFTDRIIFSEVIEEIKKMGVLTANFSCNNTHQFYLTENIAPHYDFNLHSEKSVAEKFKEIGANPVWFQMAANPKYYHPINCEKIYDVSFIGANYAKRYYYLWYLLENSIDVQCFGPNWLENKKKLIKRNSVREIGRYLYLLNLLFTYKKEKRIKLSSKIYHYDNKMLLISKFKDHFHQPVSDDEMVKIYNKSKISLGFLEVFENHDPSRPMVQHLHLREFEAPMCRSLYFTNYSEELTEFYIPNKEIITYQTEHELLYKVKYYLNHPSEAEKIRSAGYKRAKECHSYQKRFKDLFKRLGLT